MSAADDSLGPLTTFLSEGEKVALAIVIASFGSSPRPVGSMMAITQSGRIAGSVSGGCVESAVIHAAQEKIFSGGAPQILHYGVTNERAFEVGLACGGEITVLLTPLRGNSMALIAEWQKARDDRKEVALGTRMRDGEVQILPSLGAVRDAIGSGMPIHRIELAGEAWIINVIPPPLRMLVVGAVHITQNLVPMATVLGLAVTVIDPRRALATVDRFPGAAISHDWPDQALRSLALGPRDAVLALSHDSKFDDPALDAALCSPAFYIGALGSQKSQGARRARLMALGHDETTLARLRGPVGLPIGAIGAAEIALSILAGIIAAHRQSPLATLPWPVKK